MQGSSRQVNAAKHRNKYYCPDNRVALSIRQAAVYDETYTDPIVVVREADTCNPKLLPLLEQFGLVRLVRVGEGPFRHYYYVVYDDSNHCTCHKHVHEAVAVCEHMQAVHALLLTI